MKRLPLALLGAALTLAMVACGDPAPPPVTEATTASLNLTLNGVPAAPVKVLNAAGELKFDGTVTGSKTLADLPRGKYTVTGGAVANFAAPASQGADLSAGSASVTLNYLALAGQALSPDRIQGTLGDPLARGADLTVFNQNTPDAQNFPTTYATTTVGGDGSVLLPFTQTPPSTEFFPLLPPSTSSCSFSGTATDPNGTVAVYFSAYLDTKAGDPLGNVIEVVLGSAPPALVYRAYAPAAQSYKGTVRCQDGSTTTFNLNLSKGWNALLYTTTPGSTPAVTNDTLVSAPADARTELRLIKYKQAVTMFLDAPALTLKPGESVAVNATLFQTGGISGKIDLSTDVPGVTVEPASIMLAPLGTQSLRPGSALGILRSGVSGMAGQGLSAQRLTTKLTFRASADAGSFSGNMNVMANQGGTTVGGAGIPLSIQAPSVVANVSQAAVLGRGEKTTLDVQIGSSGGFKGDAVISLEGLPEGVTATTATVTFTGQTYDYKYAQLTLSASQAAKPSKVEAAVVTNAAGTIARSKVTVEVPAPAVILSFPSNGYSLVTVDVFRNETVALPVAVQGIHGFSGSETLTLTGLPAGITSTPLTVSLMPGVEARASFQLTATADAAVGTAKATVIGNDLAPSTSYSNNLSVNVNVLLARQAIEGSQFAPASGGIWALSTAVYGSGAYSRTLTLYKNGQSTFSKVFTPMDFTTSLSSTLDGKAVIIGSGKMTTVTPSGVITTVISDKLQNISSFTVDSNENVWFVGYDSSTSNHKLAFFEVATDNITFLNNMSSYIPDIYTDPARKFMYSVENSSNSVIKTDANSRNQSKINLPSNVYSNSLAVSADGSIWGLNSSGSVIKIQSDGTASIYNGLPTGKKIIADLVDSNVLWLSSSSTTDVYKINISSLTTNTYPVGGNLASLLPNSLGGAFAISAYTYSGPNYLTELK